MQRVLSTFTVKAALVFLAMLSTCAFAADVAGSVSFVIGDANVVAADGKSTPVSRGDAINTGLTLVTGATGHIHLRMIDGAFLSVRPQSKLRIEDYRYDAATPANNRIKIVLEQGVARSITGRAGEASKESYRLNTPLAAIGIRGTDFVVQASPDITRVTVQSGAVVMSPLSSDCLASALGPCKSAASRVLTAAMQNAYLELRSRNEVPLLVPAEKALDSPNLLAPPRPEEPRVSSDKHNKSGSGADTRDAIREAAAELIKNRVDASQPNASVVATAQKFWWGRWSTYMGPKEETGSLLSVLAPEREIVVANEVFGIVGEKYDGTKPFNMPNSGKAKFQLADSEAYVLNADNKLSAAHVSGSSLSVDFGARRFDTALTVNSAALAPVSVQSSGDVSKFGLLTNDPNTTGTTVNGALSNGTDQAGYIFQRILSGNTSVVGATRWTR